jgi:hypothetical protein
MLGESSGIQEFASTVSSLSKGMFPSGDNCVDSLLYSFPSTRCMPVRCYGHPIIYKATHKTYNKNFSIEGITSEERLEVERTV